MRIRDNSKAATSPESTPPKLVPILKAATWSSARLADSSTVGLFSVVPLGRVSSSRAFFFIVLGRVPSRIFKIFLRHVSFCLTLGAQEYSPPPFPGGNRHNQITIFCQLLVISSAHQTSQSSYESMVVSVVPLKCILKIALLMVRFTCCRKQYSSCSKN